MNDEWTTPQPLYDILNEEFRFTLDAFATANNAKCPAFFTKEQDALSQPWSYPLQPRTVWMNPPYSRIAECLEKAYRESQKHGNVVVALVPTRTNPPWWHEYAMKASEIRFIERKVSFGGVKKGVPFTGSAILVFRPNCTTPTVKSQRQR